jgi:formamidopyrimidine-DNA glycosylase
MPELAEVEFYRKRWHFAAVGEQVCEVRLHETKRVFRDVDTGLFRRVLRGTILETSEARAKQMMFRFTGNVWLGVHLGMSGELSVQPADYAPGKHDHLVLAMGEVEGRRQPARGTASRASAPPPRAEGIRPQHSLLYTDPRMFGQILFHVGADAPVWWRGIAPAILSADFRVSDIAAFLRRRARAPIKAVLLMQERFPGIGNWMADEILWRAAIHPARPAGSLKPGEIRALWRECRHVCRLALDAIAGKGNTLPPDLNVNIPRTWLFKHRWRKGGKDPQTGTPLAHATIGGRTTCWSPARQKKP